MSNLLLELVGSPTFNATIWPPHLFVFDDLLIYRKRNFLIVKEITISYNQIARVTLTRSLLFAHIEIETTGSDNIKVRFISKSKGTQAKAIIDQKIFRSHAKHAQTPDTDKTAVATFEKSLLRLKELLSKGAISQKEFDKKKNVLLKELKF